MIRSTKIGTIPEILCTSVIASFYGSVPLQLVRRAIGIVRGFIIIRRVLGGADLLTSQRPALVP